jgi:hypothetical protein
LKELPPPARIAIDPLATRRASIERVGPCIVTLPRETSGESMIAMEYGSGSEEAS